MTASDSDLQIALESPRTADSVALVAELDAYLGTLYAPENNYLLDVEALAAADVRFFVARRSGQAIACGALRVDRGGYGEIKRMFVRPSARGTGLGRVMLQRIEEEARSLGLGCLRLETGVHQPAAIALYRRAGYVERGPFGDYPPDGLSVFMEKLL